MWDKTLFVSYTHVVKNMRSPAVNPLDALRRAG
jgi:hypothetical protein